MRKLTLDCSQISTKIGLHLQLTELLDLPEYYGNNLDALADCLSEMHQDTCLVMEQPEALYGWQGGALDVIAPGKAIGGSYYGNYEGLLPDADGREWTECDIGTIGQTKRGAERIVFSNDGLIYYTPDHYESFELLYGEE